MRVNATCCGTPAKPGRRTEGCGCADQDASSCSAGTLGAPKGATPPRVIYQVDPEFSEKARRSKFSGNVQVGLKVDTTGNPADLWLIRAVGMGLDAKAVEAVSQYRFAPATCNGTPIAVSLYIDVNFQIF
jgi:protein TonB